MRGEEPNNSAPARRVRAIFGGGATAGLTDAQLLERFLARRDEVGETAFEALIARHGPMVWGVCRRLLRDPYAAEDAFQATFLVLVKKARSLRVGDSLGGWLYGVTHRVASRARADAQRRERRESTGIPFEPETSSKTSTAWISARCSTTSWRGCRRNIGRLWCSVISKV